DLFAGDRKPKKGERDGDEKRRDRVAVNPELARLLRDHWKLSRREDRGPRRGRGARSRRGPGKAVYTPTRYQLAEKLEAESLLPAIVFIFSRQGCDAAVLQCLYAGINLTTSEERERIVA